jgi:hypothetical protein
MRDGGVAIRGIKKRVYSGSALGDQFFDIFLKSTWPIDKAAQAPKRGYSRRWSLAAAGHAEVGVGAGGVTGHQNRAAK